MTTAPSQSSVGTKYKKLKGYLGILFGGFGGILGFGGKEERWPQIHR
jgi:hypothetical protein